MFENDPIETPCPSCGTKFSFMLSDVKLGKHPTCLGCGEVIKIDPGNSFDELENVNEAVRDFEATFEKINKRRK